MDVQETCPQCTGSLSNGPTRLVQDACGHKKCRLCLLNDEVFCKQCTVDHPGAVSPDAQIDCHTTVITYQKKSEKNASASNVHKIKQERLDAEVPDVPEGSQPAEPDKPEGTDLKQGNDLKDQGILTEKWERHISFDPKTQTYACNYCQKTFTGKSKIKNHKYCNGEKRPFVCDICNQGFISKSHCSAHLLTHQKSKPYKCTAAGCGKTFSERSKLNRHRSTHGTNRPFVCQECGKTFKIKENLRTHSLIHKQEKPYACTECDLRFSHSSNLKKHSSVHTSEKAHMCDQCGKRYKLKWALTLHRRVHAKARPNTCATCHKSFVYVKDLARHQLIHAESKGYRCGICGSTFRRKDNLSRHARNTHPGKKPQIVKCVDTPNAIKVITSPPVAQPSVKVEAAPSQSAKPDRSIPAHNQPVHVPVKLAFKTLSFKSTFKINNDSSMPKPENVSIYEKILKPRSEAHRSSAATINTNVLKDATKESPSAFEQRILAPFNAPSHYETSFDNKQHAVIKNIKFKLPDKYTNLNSTREKPKIPGVSDNNITTPSVIVNTTGNAGNQQQTV